MLHKYLPLIVVPLALMLWGLFGATQLATTSFTSFVDYHTPYADQLAPGNDGEPLTSHVVIIVADGLRLDESQKMSNVNALRARGADRVMRVGLPSLSLPGWTAISTGAWQEQHGQTTNFDAKPSPLDSIFLAARRTGLTTALTGSPGWDVLFKDQLDSILIEPDPQDAHHHPDEVRRQDDAIEANALKLITEKNPNLLLIHFSAIDDAYHGYGVFSPQGQRARDDVDARLGRLLQAIDLDKTAVLFTSDHGHIDRGGHAGPEDVVLNVAFVAAGRAIKTGRYDLAMQADIAPTTAVLLGTNIPTDNQGDVLDDMLAMPQRQRAQRRVDWVKQFVARADSLAQVIAVGSVAHPKLAQAESALASGDDVDAISAAQAEVQATRDALVAFREGRLQTERITRTPLFVMFLLPLALYMWFMRKMNWEFGRPLFGGLIFFIVYYALFFGRSYYFSLSLFNEDTNIQPWFAARVVDTLIALLVSSALLGIVTRDDTKYQTTLHVINMAFVVFAVLWFQVCVFYWLYDFTWSWSLPDQVLGFKYYLDTLQTGAFMLQSPPVPTILMLPLIALAAKWLAERVPARRSSHVETAHEPTRRNSDVW